MKLPRLAPVAIPLLLAAISSAATLPVDSLAALLAALQRAAPGDRIVLKSGSYTATAPLEVKVVGTAAAPITIAAERVGGVELGGAHGFTLVAPAAHVTIEGFVFAHAAGKAAIGSGTTGVRFTRNTFRCTGAGPYLTVTGDQAEVDHNEFRDKATLGNMISVTGTAGQVARKLWIHHNYFHDFANARGNGAETIRFGLSGLSLSRGEGLVEHNLFVRCQGENELISNKSCANTYRYNTIVESPGTQLTLRHGNDCLVYGNILRNTDGIRLFGDRHVVFSNYLEGNSMGINLGNGGAEVADGAPLTSHDRPDHCVIAFNTLVNNTAHYRMTERRPTALGATNTTFAYNVLVGGGLAAQIQGPNTGAKWFGNLLWKTKGAGDLPASSYTEADPQFAPDAHGVPHVQPGSPAIDAGDTDAAAHPELARALAAVTLDLDGQPRTGRKDLGADEFSDAPVVVRLLTPAEVGPLAQ